ncbi:LuxR C-terminal-related transcriptional regulator [Lentzea sp. JNUCC 0626]|uniref:helix-turn-helix transcriptional regulator n=1 Tax=Lentzea sp. JNUCC 0626 TaxID=3367513 RepID=UPI0037492E1F
MADRRVPEHPDQRLTRSVPRRSNGDSRRGTDSHPLLERDAALRAVLSGPPQVVVSGGLGCGRTSLVRAALDRTTARVAAATAVRSERSVPHGIANQLAPHLSRTRPTLVVVDDVQHADPESVAFLVWLRRFPNIRVVVTHAATDSPHRVELSTWHQIWLRPLSTGNPALLAAARADGGEVGPVTRRTFLDLVRDNDLFEVACGLAVLGRHRAHLGALTNRHPQDVVTLTDSGLHDGTGFVLPGAEEILLGALPPAQVADLRRRAAALLHDAGAPDVDVAEHCVAAQAVDDLTGGIPLLRRAARTAASAFAVDCLRLALRAGEDEAVRVDLGRAQWRTDPAAAARTLLPCTSDDPVVVRARWWQGDFSPAISRCTAELSLCHEFLTGRPLQAVDPEAVLRQRGPDTAPEALAQALRLVRTDRWQARIANEAEGTLRALLDAVRAEDSWRRGDVLATAASARSALGGLSPDGWGAALGFPLQFALLADAALGRESRAHRVPDALSRSAFWPGYLRARGHHHLALGRPHAALDDFTACADRLGEAAARIELGQPGWARTLLEEEIAATTDPRTTGVAVRLLARISSGADRSRLLHDAVRGLEHAGDHLELSRALADLAHDRSERGALADARLLGRRARRESGLPGEPAAEDGALSAAERKVAALAAAGHGNREIARRLYVTVSTVEQHLTRVYRKLSIAGRDDLPRELLTR